MFERIARLSSLLFGCEERESRDGQAAGMSASKDLAHPCHVLPSPLLQRPLGVEKILLGLARSGLSFPALGSGQSIKVLAECSAAWPWPAELSELGEWPGWRAEFATTWPVVKPKPVDINMMAVKAASSKLSLTRGARRGYERL